MTEQPSPCHSVGEIMARSLVTSARLEGSCESPASLALNCRDHKHPKTPTTSTPQNSPHCLPSCVPSWGSPHPRGSRWTRWCRCSCGGSSGSSVVSRNPAWPSASGASSAGSSSSSDAGQSQSPLSPLSPLHPPLSPLSPQCPDDADRAAEPGAGPPVPRAPGTGGGLRQLAWGGGGSARDRRGGPEGPRALSPQINAVF